MKKLIPYDSTSSMINEIESNMLKLDSNGDLSLSNNLNVKEISNGLLPWYDSKEILYNEDGLKRVNLSKTGQYVLTGSMNYSTSNYSFLSKDYGETFEQLSIEGKFHDSAISEDGQIMCICRDTNSIIVSNDSGENWNENLYSVTISNPVVSMSDNGQYMLVATSTGGPYIGKVYLSNDYGNSFNEIPFFNSLGNSECDVNFDGSRMLVATSSKIYKSTDYGLNWNEIYSGSVKPLRASKNGNVIAGVRRIGPPWGPLFISKDDGATWNTTYLPAEFYPQCTISLSYDGSIIIFSAILYTGSYKSWISNNYGDTWIEFSMPNSLTFWESQVIDDNGIMAIGLNTDKLYKTKNFYISKLKHNANPNNWNSPAPTDVSEALERLAAAIKLLGGNP